MKRVWLVGGLVLFGCIFAIAKLSILGGKHFELRAHTEIVQGVRATPYTDYWYDEVDGIMHKNLWHERRMEKYREHWISPSGVVWISTDRFSGPGGGDKIWAALPTGPIPGARFSASTRPSGSVDVGVAESFRGGIGELLTLNKGTSRDRRLLIFRSLDAKQLIVSSTVTHAHPTFMIEDILRSKGHNDPVVAQVSDVYPSTFLISAKAKASSVKDTVLMFGGRAVGIPNDPWAMELQIERELPAVPEQVLTTTSGYLVYLLFDPTAKTSGAWFDVCDFSGDLKYRADLMSLGKYRSVEEAKESILPSVSWWVGGSGWQKLPHKFPNSYARVLDRFDFYDTNGKRFEITATAKEYQFDHATSIVQTGLAARRNLVDTKDKKDVIWSRTSDSPNGIFHVKVVGRDWSKMNKSWDQTVVSVLMTATVNDHGTPVEVQVAQKSAYGEVWPIVTDSGRMFLLELGKANTGTQRNVDRAEIVIAGVGTINAGGIGLLRSDDQTLGVAKYTNNEEVKKGIRWDKVKIVSHGKKTTQQYLGVELPLWEVEEFWIPQANGTTIHQAIINGNFAPTVIENGNRRLLIPED